MSIVIKGMEMPRHCGECGIEWCDRWKQLIIAGMSIAKTRPSDCQLIEFPPHGRLIDADALMNKLQALYDERADEARYTGSKEIKVSWNDAVYKIIDAPTIIPAEEE